MSDPGPGGRVLDFVIQERRRAFFERRRVLEISDTSPSGPATVVEGGYDGAWVSLSSLEGVDLSALGRRVAEALVPGAAVVCVVPGARPLGPLLRRALRGSANGDSGASEGKDAPTRASLARWRDAFGGAFRWRRTRALGLLLAGGDPDGEEETSPRALAAWAVLEHVIGGWPVFRGLGERILLEGERR